MRLPSALDYLPNYAPPRRRRRSVLDQFTPEEQQSLLGSLGRTTLSGIQKVGWALDTPGAVVRGALAGRPRELATLVASTTMLGLPLLPFIRRFIKNPPGEPERISGRELLERYGILGRNQPGLDVGDVAGFVTEVLLDPLTYLSFGTGAALSKGGQLAKAAGVLKLAERGGRVGKRVARMTTTLEDLIRIGGPEAAKAIETAAAARKIRPERLAKLMKQPLGGLVGVSPIPMAEPRWVLGTGKMAQRVARGMDVLGDRLLYSAPVRHVAPLFEKRLRGATTEGAQRVMRAVAPRIEVAERAAREEGIALARMMQKAGIEPHDPVVRDIVRHVEGVKQLPPGPLREIGDRLKGAMQRIHAAEKEAGLPTTELDDVVAYMTAQRQQFRTPMKRTAEGLVPVKRRRLEFSHPFARRRESLFKGHPGGRASLSDLSVDPRFSGKPLPPAGTEAFKQEMEARLALLKAEYAGQFDEKKLRRLIQWAANLDPQHAEYGISAWVEDLPGLLAKRAEASKRAIAGADVFYTTLAKHAVAGGDAEMGMVRLSDVLKQAGMATPQGRARMIREALLSSPDLAKRITDAEDVASFIGKLYVPREIADDMLGVMRSFTVPEEIGKLAKAMEKGLDWWRAHVTVYWPAYLTRNFTGGQIQNALLLRSPTRALRCARMAYRILRGEPVKELLDLPIVKQAGIKDAKQATEFIADLMAREQLIGSFAPDILETKATGWGLVPEHLVETIPGTRPFKGVGRTVLSGVPRPGRWNPFDIETFGPIVAGREINQLVEGLNRGGLWLGLLEKGYSPIEAAARTRLAHVAYGNLTNFERKYMRNLIPFYSFAKGQAKFLAKELMEHPGGPFAQTIRAANVARGEIPFVPDYLAQTVGIPIPSGTPLVGPEPGSPNRRYLAGAGLMFEDPLQFLGGAPGVMGTLKGGLQEALSRSNPLIKAPFEWASGVTLFQAGPRGGRLLEDADPTIGRILANVRDMATGAQPGTTEPVRLPGPLEHAVMNVIPRPFTTLRTLTDPRKSITAKAANVLTGLRFYDVSPAIEESLIRESVEQRLRDTGVAKAFTRTYIPSDVLSTMPPAQQKKAKQALAMLTLLARRAKARSEGQPLQPLTRSW